MVNTAVIFIDKQGNLAARYFTSSAPYEIFRFFGRWPEEVDDFDCQHTYLPVDRATAATKRLLDKNACEEGYSIELEMMEVIPDLKSKVVIGDVLKTMINIFQLEEVSLDNLDPNIDYAAPATVLLSDGCSIRNKYTYTIPETNNYDLYVLPVLGIMDEEIGAEFLEFSSFDEFLEKLSNIQKRQYPLGSDGSEWDDEDVTEDSSCDDGFNYMKSKKIYVLNPAWLHSDETGIQGLDSEYPE